MGLATLHESTVVECSGGIRALPLCQPQISRNVGSVFIYLMNLITVISVQDVAVERRAAGLGKLVELTAEILALAVETGDGTGDLTLARERIFGRGRKGTNLPASRRGVAMAMIEKRIFDSGFGGLGNLNMEIGKSGYGGCKNWMDDVELMWIAVGGMDQLLLTYTFL